MTIEEAAVQLSNDVYKAALVYEHCEGAGLIHGNGHHMAQSLAQEAVRRLRVAHQKKELASAGIKPSEV